MTQAQLKLKILRLQCCSGNMSNEIATLMINGDKSCKSKIDRLLILNDYIDLLLKYDLTTDAINCLTEDEFTNILNNATVICKLCDCE
jgi:hypothetical protein